MRPTLPKNNNYQKPRDITQLTSNSVISDFPTESCKVGKGDVSDDPDEDLEKTPEQIAQEIAMAQQQSETASQLTEMDQYYSQMDTDSNDTFGGGMNFED